MKTYPHSNTDAFISSMFTNSSDHYTMGLKYYSNGLRQIPADFEAPIYANTPSEKYSSYTSIRNYHGMIYPLQKNIYANISSETLYGTLMNTTSTTLPLETNVQKENIQRRSVESSPIYINLNNLEENRGDVRKINQEEEIRVSSIHSKRDIETNILVERSMIQTKPTIKKVEMSKSDSHRTRIPRIPSSLRRRRTLNRPRRYRRGSTTPFRATTNSTTSRRQQPRSNPSTDRAMNSNHRRKRSAHRSATNQLYHEIDPAVLYDSEEIFEDPLQFNQLRSSYPDEELLEQVIFTSENRQSLPQDEFCPHDTFEDFLLRRRPKSSSSTLASVTNTLISSETLSQEVPPRPPPLNPRLPGIALSLDKKDVDFIHDIIQRTHGDRRVSNRITALKEAYVRAASKRLDLLKAKQTAQLNENQKKKKVTMKHSVSASKIRDELEKYDELPVPRRSIFHDENEDDDETYSTNDEYRYQHRRRLPPEPSTTHRIVNFLTTLKRQVQKNFHEIRSRILIEAMSNHRHKHSFHHTNRPSRRPKTSHGILPRSISHNSVEHCYSPHRRPHFSRSHSNISPGYLPSSEKYYTNRPRTFQITPHS